MVSNSNHILIILYIWPINKKLHHRKNLPYKYKKSVNTKVYKHPENTLTKGARIINLDKLQQYNDSLTAHASHCEGSILLYGETRHGLATILKGHCSTCVYTVTLESSNKVKGPKGYF